MDRCKAVLDRLGWGQGKPSAVQQDLGHGNMSLWVQEFLPCWTEAQWMVGRTLLLPFNILGWRGVSPLSSFTAVPSKYLLSWVPLSGLWIKYLQPCGTLFSSGTWVSSTAIFSPFIFFPSNSWLGPCTQSMDMMWCWLLQPRYGAGDRQPHEALKESQD